jgi:pilus assembly protein CpaC
MACCTGGSGEKPRRSMSAGRAWRACLALCSAVMFASASLATAQETNVSAKTKSAITTGAIAETGSTVRRLTVTRNKSRTIKLDVPFDSAVVGSPEIADVLPMSDKVIYVQGKKVGTTNVSVFDKAKQLMTVIDVEVTIDTRYIAKSIQSSIESPGVRVSSADEQIVLSGTARNAVDGERAVAIAKAMAPEMSVINAMKIDQPQQVMLKVRYLEANRNAARELGVNWYGSNRNGTRGVNAGLGAPTQVGQSPNATPGGLPLFEAARTFASGGTSAPFSIAIASLLNSGIKLDVLVSALEKKGLVRLLAEPNLVALSGDKASFLAGGEIPVPVVQPLGSISVEYKPFGVQLDFEPTVVNAGIINLRIAPVVSQLDYTNAVEVQGFRIPALSKRETRTTIELRSGQSFAISGLLQAEGLRDISQVPWLGSVPVLGALFRSSSYQKRETDLVVIVTPHLVAPAAPGQELATPFDQRLPSNDRDFFLNGRMELRKKYRDYVTAGGDRKGPYGHIIGEPAALDWAPRREDVTWKH